MQDDNVMFLKTEQKTTRRRRGTWITPCKPSGTARGKGMISLLPNPEAG